VEKLPVCTHEAIHQDVVDAVQKKAVTEDAEVPATLTLFPFIAAWFVISRSRADVGIGPYNG